MIDIDAIKAPIAVGPAKIERTFMVNVVAPFYITYKMLTEYKNIRRVVTTSSGAMSDMKGPLDPKNIPLIVPEWAPFKQYQLTKLYVVMFMRGLFHAGVSHGTTLITLCPGQILTNMLGTATQLLNPGFKPQGTELTKATHTYILATRSTDDNPLGLPKFYKLVKESRARELAQNTDACKIFFQFMVAFIN